MIGAPVVFCEVICDHSSRGSAAFGVVFTDRAMAGRYARSMRRAGYGASLSPDFEAEASVQSALSAAAAYFDHPELLAGSGGE